MCLTIEINGAFCLVIREKYRRPPEGALTANNLKLRGGHPVTTPELDGLAEVALSVHGRVVLLFGFDHRVPIEGAGVLAVDVAALSEFIQDVLLPRQPIDPPAFHLGRIDSDDAMARRGDDALLEHRSEVLPIDLIRTGEANRVCPGEFEINRQWPATVHAQQALGPRLADSRFDPQAGSRHGSHGLVLMLQQLLHPLVGFGQGWDFLEGVGGGGLHRAGDTLALKQLLELSRTGHLLFGGPDAGQQALLAAALLR